jgi:hypothetical protein
VAADRTLGMSELCGRIINSVFGSCVAERSGAMA